MVNGGDLSLSIAVCHMSQAEDAAPSKWDEFLVEGQTIINEVASWHNISGWDPDISQHQRLGKAVAMRDVLMQRPLLCGTMGKAQHQRLGSRHFNTQFTFGP